jgi:tRNA modification GTPase
MRPAEPAFPQRPRRELAVGWVVDEAGEPLDEVVLLTFRAPHSYTTEDVAEFQCHAGPAVVQKLLSLALEAGARLAAAGEFTKRAFLNGRLDLSQAEAVNDLVTARSERGLAQALAQLDGALSRQVASMRAEVIGWMARIEAAIDYPDEIEDLAAGESEAALARLIAELDGILATAKQGQLFREGARLAIVGQPNVGKSSLLNALLGTSRAIVTAIAGTTRDVLEEGLELAGMPFRVVDTAGIRETHDPIEAIGVARSREVVATADVVMLVVDLERGVEDAEHELRGLVGGRPLVVVGNKHDLADAPLDVLGAPWVKVSANSGEGLGDLTRLLVEVTLGMPVAAVAPASINARHRASLQRARECLARALGQGLPADILAIDLADAARALGEVEGDALAEEVIDQVFARFCVGK